MNAGVWVDCPDCTEGVPDEEPVCPTCMGERSWRLNGVDADLAIAAPELLEALRSVVALVDLRATQFRGLDALVRARAAIAKATGGGR